MALGTAPLFATAPRISLYVGNIQIGFAIGVNINVSIELQPVQIIGKFGPVSIEPTGYNVVTGTMQSIRVASTESITNQISVINQTIATSAQDGTAIATTIDPVTGKETINDINQLLPTELDSNNILAQAGIFRHMNPAQVLFSRSFDLDLYMQIPNIEDPGVIAALQDNIAAGSELTEVNVQKKGQETTGNQLNIVPWMRVKGCRITSRNVNIASGQIINEPVSFQGLLLSPYDANSESEELLFTSDAGVKQGTP